MAERGFPTIDQRIERLEDRIEHLCEMVGRIADEVESGLADLRSASDQEFKQLKQAILFWGNRARMTDDREHVRRRGSF